MGIEEILAADAPKVHFPATNMLQDFVLGALDAHGAEASGDSALVAALGKSLLVLEGSVVKDRTVLLNTGQLVMSLSAYVYDLERRLKEAGVPLGPAREQIMQVTREKFDPLL